MSGKSKSTEGPGFDPEHHWSQKKFAELLGINQSQVSRAISRGILKRNDTFIGWLRSYVHHLSEEAAGRRSGDADLIRERSRLSKLQADRIIFELKQKGTQVAPIDTMTFIMSQAVTTIRSRILALPHKLKSLFPYIPDTDVSKIDDAVRSFLMELSQLEFPESARAKIAEMDAEFWGDLGSYPSRKVRKNG